MTGRSVTLDRPWLSFDLQAPKQVLSWAINRPGFVIARRIVWREVRIADLPPELDVHDWLARDLAARGEAASVAFLTSRNITHHHVACKTVEASTALAVATVGLSNAERVGSRQLPHPLRHGTINIAVELDTPLSQTGLIEALSVAVQARTAAVIETGVGLSNGAATGTGTDCVAIAAPEGRTDYAGLHTAVGEAVGNAVYTAVLQGAQEWKEEQGENVNA
ncbi:MAG: adenosylcobinamide amidohydrolase [Pseudomonadota bacterium]